TLLINCVGCNNLLEIDLQSRKLTKQSKPPVFRGGATDKPFFKHWKNGAPNQHNMDVHYINMSMIASGILKNQSLNINVEYPASRKKRYFQPFLVITTQT